MILLTFVGSHHEALSKETNPNNEKGILADVIKNADVFIGVSRAKLVSQDMVLA